MTILDWIFLFIIGIVMFLIYGFTFILVTLCILLHGIDEDDMSTEEYRR